MFWVQALCSFFVWIAGGVWLARRPDPYLQVSSRSRGVRTSLGAVLMLGAVATLLATMIALARQGGFQSNAMPPFHWLSMTVAGLVFVVLNTIGMRLLASLAREAAVTEKRSAASTSQELD